MPAVPNFAGPAYSGQSSLVAGEECINLVPEINETPTAKSQASLYPIPGVRTAATLTAGPGRAIFGETDRLFAVGGDKAFALTYDAGTDTLSVGELGTVSDDGRPGQIASSGDGGEEVFIVAGGEGYILNTVTNVFSNEVSGVHQCGHVDGFFVGLDFLTSTLKISELLAGTTWDPSQTAQRSSDSDRWRSMLIHSGEIYLFGEKTGDVYYNAGLSPFPFAPRRGVVFEPGIAAAWSLAPFNGSMAWLGNNERGGCSVYRMNGYSPNRISNNAIDWHIQQYRENGGVGDARGYSYEMAGHPYYLLTFPTQRMTWVYDGATNWWHRRGKWNALSGAFDAYRPLYYANVFGKDLTLDLIAPLMHQFSTSVYTDVEGSVLRRVRRPPRFFKENKRITVQAIELEAERGVGLTQGQGSDPKVMLCISKNGGRTWGPERSRSMGAKGQWSQRIRWAPCGAGRDIQTEFVATDPVATRWFDCFVDLSVGRH